MVLQSFEEHISPECDGSGYKICVFSDSLDLIRGYLGVKIRCRSRYIDFEIVKVFFSCIPSRHIPGKYFSRKFVTPFYDISIFGVVFTF